MPRWAASGERTERQREANSMTAAKKVDEKAYKAALERIPEPKEKYDPWGVARPADAAKDTAKKPEIGSRPGPLLHPLEREFDRF